MVSRMSPKKSSRTGAGQARRIEIDNAAAQGIFAALANSRCAQKSVGFEPERRGRGDRRRRRARPKSSWPPSRLSGGTRWVSAATVVSSRRGFSSEERVRASRANAVMRCAAMAGVRRHAIIRLAVPGREFEDFRFRRREGKGFAEGAQTLAVARHMDQRARPRPPRPGPSRGEDRRRRRQSKPSGAREKISERPFSSSAQGALQFFHAVFQFRFPAAVARGEAPHMLTGELWV